VYELKAQELQGLSSARKTCLEIFLIEKVNIHFVKGQKRKEPNSRSDIMTISRYEGTSRGWQQPKVSDQAEQLYPGTQTPA